MLVSNEQAVTILWLVILVLPYFLFVFKNDFSSKKITFIRALISIFIGWGYVLSYTLASHAIYFMSSYNETGAISYAGNDGASLAFVSVFGWIIPAIVVSIAWILHAFFKKREHCKESN